jgi:hypothetical protein
LAAEIFDLDEVAASKGVALGAELEGGDCGVEGCEEGVLGVGCGGVGTSGHLFGFPDDGEDHDVGGVD